MIDLVYLKKEIKDGTLEVYKKRGRIFIKDAKSDECIMICDIETVKEKGVGCV